jgi:putative ABC transport system permease protein
VPLAQDTPGDIFLLVRPESGRAEALTSLVRAAMARIDTQQLVSVRGVMTLDDVASTATAQHRFRAVLVGAFAAVSLLLTMVGLFGNLAYTVQRRVRELAVRRALGATTSDVLRLVGGNAFPAIAAGALVGLAAAAALARLLTTMLFEVRPLDAPTFVSVATVVVLTAIAATIGPAWRATRVDPALSLRSE